MSRERVYEAVMVFLASKYGPVELELSRTYDRQGVVEVAGKFRLESGGGWRRFTLLLSKKDMKVLGFGMR
ncbi:MAG: hypothetical protein QXS57_00655 [Candidatus Caldarchaeum sp.]|uniref:Uncharacterized protein n=1 Tax=Caldiarchaeum subterraneum TaxID=311458 RepID=A0A7J3VUJ8_CALS0